MRDNQRRQMDNIRNNQGRTLNILRQNNQQNNDDDGIARMANIIRANNISQNNNNRNISHGQNDISIVNNFMNNILSQILTNENRNNNNNINNNERNEINETNENIQKQKLDELLEEIEINVKLIDKLETKQCNICLDNFKKGEKICYLSCVHYFHAICIKCWVKKSNKCPLCKNVIKFE